MPPSPVPPPHPESVTANTAASFKHDARAPSCHYIEAISSASGCRQHVEATLAEKRKGIH